MFNRKISATLTVALFVTLATQMGTGYQASAGKFLNQTGCSQCCPECNHCCKLEAEEGEVEKKCFEVETKVICIPRVVFPWQTGDSCFPFCKRNDCQSCQACDGRGCSACVHNGARTRTVKVLRSKQYKCPKCEYTWSAEPKTCQSSCGPGGNSGCCDKCCDGGCDTAYLMSPKGAPTWAAAGDDETSSEGLLSVDVQNQ